MIHSSIVMKALSVNSLRLRAAAKASAWHFLATAAVALSAGILVFSFWYPSPFQAISGGRELFLLIVAVDTVCGPLLTLVLFNPKKPRAELVRDLSLVVGIQIAALGYGLSTVWEARPIFLVNEVDRFKPVSLADIEDGTIASLPANLRPGWFDKPIAVGIRDPIDQEEKNKVLFESVQGGRDYAERPEFYLPYAGDVALKAVKRAKPLEQFLTKYPDQLGAATELASSQQADLMHWMYLPVRGREDWVAIVDSQGKIQGFLKGDGF